MINWPEDKPIAICVNVMCEMWTDDSAPGVGAMGNPLFLAFDKAVRGMVVGDQALVSASGGEYDPNLLFKVPTSHPEVARLREELDQPGKGGLHPGATVRELCRPTPSLPRV